MEGRVRLAIRATVPGERSIWLAVPCTRVVRDWCVRVELRLRNRRDSLPLHEETGSSQGCTKSEQRSGGAQPDTEGGHRSEEKARDGLKRDVQNAGRGVQEVDAEWRKGLWRWSMNHSVRYIPQRLRDKRTSRCLSCMNDWVLKTGPAHHHRTCSAGIPRLTGNVDRRTCGHGGGCRESR